MTAGSGRKRILLVEDNRHMREAVRTVVADDPTLELVAEAGCGADALVLAQQEQPDVIVCDLHLPATRTHQTLVDLRQLAPGAAILVYTATGSDREIAEAMSAGAAGFLEKDADGLDLLRAIHEVAAGRVWMTRRVRRAIDRPVHP